MTTSWLVNEAQSKHYIQNGSLLIHEEFANSFHFHKEGKFSTALQQPLQKNLRCGDRGQLPHWLRAPASVSLHDCSYG